MASIFDQLIELQNQLQNLYTQLNAIQQNMYNMYYSTTPTDIQIPQINPDGTITNVTVPNHAKIKQMIWDDVGGALGQFYKTVYVDSVNGDDTNPGTIDAPFKTLTKAVDSIPAGGYGIIKLNSDVYLDTRIELKGRILYITPTTLAPDTQCCTPNQNNPWIYAEGNIGTNGDMGAGFVGQGMVITEYVNIETKPCTNCGIWRGFIGRHDNSKYILSMYAAYIKIGTNNELVRIQSGPAAITEIALYNCNISFTDANFNTLIELEDSAPISFKPTGSTATDANGNSLTWQDVISGIIRDTNGLPRNVISNVVL